MNLILPTITMAIIISITITIIMPMHTKSMKNKMMMMTLISLIPLNSLLNNKEMTMSSPPIIITPTENIYISLTLDMLSMMFIPIALLITWSISEFSTWYMSSDPNTNKFIKYLLTFLITMLIIISANSMYQLFIGWEAVGIMSFLLINWWHDRSNANTSALQAIIYNRMGDIGLIMTTAWLMTTSSINFQETMALHNMSLIPMIGLLTAAAGKSAQFTMHPWLPSAMEGPTPVSALLHSSTMVVAGIFLLTRLNPLLQNKAIMTMCLILGATTTIFAAASATTQYDIKKIIALSTTSQLGLMMTMIGLNQPSLAFLHMMTHSFFKALLFLCSGSFIHSMNNEQDVRKMGGLLNLSPMTGSFMTIANLSLMGTPFLSGFYSKDTIIETMMNSHTNSWALITTLTATTLSAMYSTRITLLTLTNYPRIKQTLHMESNKTASPMARLAIMSIIAGTMTKLTTLQNTAMITMPLPIKLTAMTATLIGIILSNDYLFFTKHSSPKKSKTLTTFFNQLAFFNIPHRALPMATLKFSQQTSTELMDLWLLEAWGPKGLSNMLKPMIHLSTQQNNLMKNYMLTFIITLMLSLIILMI
uniref:NADH-ubiquinone oxidoreductase chain 5 n=1 Tax=Emydocephalus annulatus TaxID=355678 RepID=A0A6B9PFA0_9SAUR|nr:NADH dehydrogenase subunit 5 [Emydocephalus ijimae]QHD48178.1 NADH dehydrogenase subunit 5 [Emydocephalus ijimae]BDB03959.1 NADH dehydrogenase subunit 5 [Emydocephalus ijimae]